MPPLLWPLATLRIHSPIELVQAGEALGNSWFRGQGSKRWGLQSTLERDSSRFEVPSGALLEREEVMLKLFRERADLYDQAFVAPTSIFEWLSLIRHYGGPSRLLDVTSSYLVAGYFALTAAPPKVDAAVWAFCFRPDLNGQSLIPDATFEANATPGVVVGKPDRLNDRMNAQSGGFLVPRSLNVSLEEQLGMTLATNLKEIRVYKSVRRLEKETTHQIWRLIIPHGIHNELFRFLSRCNVRAYSLYPGLDGLAWSLQEMMRAFS